MAVEPSYRSSMRVLKLDVCTNEAVFCVLLVFIDSVPAYAEVHCGSPLENSDSFKAGPSSQSTGKAPVDG